MGFSFRGRTKGTSGWINYSTSSKGPSTSYSQKLGKNLTFNFGKNGTKTTYNFGNGLRWTSTKSSKNTKSKNNIRDGYQHIDSNFTWAGFFEVICIILCIIAVPTWAYYFGNIWIVPIIITLWYGWIYFKRNSYDESKYFYPLMPFVLPPTWVLLAISWGLTYFSPHHTIAMVR